MPREGHYPSCQAALGERCWCEVKHYTEMLGFSALIFCIEIVAAYFSGSLALYADAWHVAGDNLALLLNLFTAVLAALGAERKMPRSVAFYAGLLLLIGIALWIIWEGAHRFMEPPHVTGSIMIVGATVCAALLWWQIRQHATVAHEHKDAAHAVMHKHFKKDFLINVAVVLGGIVLIATDVRYIDPVLSIGIGVYILWDLAFGHRHAHNHTHHH